MADMNAALDRTADLFAVLLVAAFLIAASPLWVPFWSVSFAVKLVFEDK